MLQRSRSDEPEVLIARYDRRHALAPIFRPLKNGKRGRLKVTVPRDKYGVETRWRGDELDGTDQSVLLACITLAGLNTASLDLIGDEEDSVASTLRSRMLVAAPPAEMKVALYGASLYAIAQTLGWSSGGMTWKRILDCLDHLLQLNVTYISEGKRAGFPVFGYVVVEGRVWIAVNPALTSAILGNPGITGYVQYDMGERRRLHSDAAQIAHAWLSAWLEPGKSNRISLDRLAGHVWCETPTTWNSAVRRRRRHTLRKSLDELRAVGWTIAEGDNAMLRVRRPATKTCKQQTDASTQPQPELMAAA